MIPVRDLFESHLTVADLQRSMSFFGQTLGLELAEVFWEQRVAFYWIGGRGTSMLGLWEVGTGPQRLSLHIAFRADLAQLLDAPACLRAANVVPLDFWGQPTDEPVVLGWMPAAISVTQMEICSSCFRCCLIPRNQNWELSVGVAGTKFTNPFKGRWRDNRRPFDTLRSTPTERVSIRLKLLVCFARTGVNRPETMSPN